MEKRIIPAELMETWDEYIAARKARDSAVKGYFKYQVRNAIYCGRLAEEKRREFWKNIREIYPEFEGKSIKIDAEKCEVFEYEE